MPGASHCPQHPVLGPSGNDPRGQGAGRRARHALPASHLVTGCLCAPLLCDRSLNPLSLHQVLARPSSSLGPPLSGHRPRRGQEAPSRPGAQTSPFSAPPACRSPKPGPTTCPGPQDSREAEPRALAEGGGVEPESVAPWPATGSACQHVPHPTPLTPSPEANSSLGLGGAQKTLGLSGLGELRPSKVRTVCFPPYCPTCSGAHNLRPQGGGHRLESHCGFCSS